MFPTRTLLGRSVWKGPNIVPYVKLTSKPGTESLRPMTPPLPLPRTFPPPANTPPIRTQKRAATILPNFVGLRFAVHNGKTYQEIQITEEMVGRKLGEYVAYVIAFLRASRKHRDEWDRMLIWWFYNSTRKRFTYKQSKNK
ncbi:mitochondrial 37S ribosomal protein RSM19 [Penicillium brasilianum]|uniref:Mitochondrial 37S ribosomal protein RSM19 n=1 Tax=Penicillium brasilianum TaxID=104259 RepID=A0A1S9RUW6_PENBI|nr:mitochondrial 37S ribosomal protein RSM19 [Penicillium brasilianum]